MIRIITAFDSWHLNGVHYPSVNVGLPGRTLEEAFIAYNSYNYSLTNYTSKLKAQITLEYLQRHYNNGRTYMPALDAGREGYIIIIEN